MEVAATVVLVTNVKREFILPLIHDWRVLLNWWPIILFSKENKKAKNFVCRWWSLADADHVPQRFLGPGLPPLYGRHRCHNAATILHRTPIFSCHKPTQWNANERPQRNHRPFVLSAITSSSLKEDVGSFFPHFSRQHNFVCCNNRSATLQVDLNDSLRFLCLSATIDKFFFFFLTSCSFGASVDFLPPPPPSPHSDFCYSPAAERWRC